jgi:hypothetical protein
VGAEPPSGEPGERPPEPQAAEARSLDAAASATLAGADPGRAREATLSRSDPPATDAGPAFAPEPNRAGEADPPATEAGPAFPPEPDPGGEADPPATEAGPIQDGIAADRVTAVLTATLDRLGAAHHRPFSRA